MATVHAITGVTTLQVLDSRGNPTVAAIVETDLGRGMAIAPAGASAGSHEAVFVRDNGPHYEGRSVSAHLERVGERVQAALMTKDADDPAAVDSALRQLDADPQLRDIGGHVGTAVSLAAWLAASAGSGREPWQAIRDYTGATAQLPMPMVNIISGGAHAGGLIDIQDILAVPIGAGSFAEAIEWCWRTRRGTQLVLEDMGYQTSLIADEGGLAAPFARDEDALAAVVAGIARAGLEPGADVSLAIDVAATQFVIPGGYAMGGGQASAAEVVARLTQWRAAYPLVSIEDGVGEDDDDGWSLQSDLCARTQVLGDDRYASRHARLTTGIARGEANAVLIKPNQAGTLHEALRTILEARRNSWATVVSARSGETEETWLSDLATGSGAGQIKVGSTMRSERTAKWNRLLLLEHESGLPYAGASLLAPIS